MKKLIVLLFTVFTFATYAQGSYYEKVHYRSTPESSWEGIDVTLNIKITSSITSGGITYGFIVDNIKINSIKIRTKEISASQIPFNVLSKLKASISIGSIYCDLYNASFFLKKIDLPKTVGWAELLEVNNEEGYKQSVKNKVTVLYNSGAFNTQNLTLVTCNYFIDDNYRKTIEKEITDNGKTKTAVKTKTSNNEAKELGLVISSSSTSPESNPDENSSLNTAKETSTNEISVANNIFAAENARKYNEQKAIVDVATGILDLFSTSPEQERQWAAEREEKKRILQDKQDFFDETYFNPLIAKAKKGDENSRMILYFASNYHDIELKDGKKWLFEAAKKNNFNAMLEVANILIQKDSIKEAITIIEEAANLGSVDAMVKLADWYDNKCRKAYSYTYVGGENPIKAFEWYEKAASKDSPVAMYRLGMIYKYSSTQDGSESYAYAKRVHVEYEIAKDESKAFEWFSKSINPNYVESLFSTSKKIKTNFWNWKDTFSAAKASFFHPDSYKQLALFYKQAKVVPKDKEMAKKLVVAYKIYVNINNF